MRRVSLASRSLTAVSSNQALITSAVLAALAVPAAAQLQFEELPRMELPVGLGETSATAFGDVDGDGDLDLVLGRRGYPSRQNRLLLNDGSGSFADVTATQMPVDTDHTLSVALGDVDADGDLDLILGNGYYDTNRLYINDGQGTFTDATANQMPVVGGSYVASSVALGDIDGDADLDLIIGNTDYYGYGNPNQVYLNNGQGTFVDATATNLPFNAGHTEAVALGDIDGDGDIDIVFGNWGQNRLYSNDGSGSFADVTAAQMPIDSQWSRALALADVDGDFDVDIVFGDVASSLGGPQNHLYVNNGQGVFTDVTATQMPMNVVEQALAIALGDIDGDLDVDMVLGNFGQERVYVNNGTGTFVDDTLHRLPIEAGTGTLSMALGDVDGDGDLDMAFGHNAPEPSLYLNLQRQLHAPTAPQIGQPYDLDAYMRYGTSNVANFAVTYLSTAPASIASPFGTIGIDPALAAPFPTLIVPQPAGVGSVGFTVPNVPAFIGQEIYSQAMLVAFPDDLRLSNVVADVIQ